MRQVKYGIIEIDMNDNTFELPEHFNHNMEIIIKQIDDIQEKIGVIQRDVQYLRTLYYGGDER